MQEGEDRLLVLLAEAVVDNKKKLRVATGVFFVAAVMLFDFLNVKEPFRSVFEQNRYAWVVYTVLALAVWAVILLAFLRRWLV